ncbi:MAG: dihydropteroate synthase [Saprospiraceae bacterium]
MSYATLNCRGILLDLSRPILMGILNTTPDSFYTGSRIPDVSALLDQAGAMLADGARILDVGGASSRPGAAEVPEAEEIRRVVPAVQALNTAFPEAILSVDTWRAAVAKEALDAGARIVNDISAGQLDKDLWDTLAGAGAPYVLMHMQGTPQTMQAQPFYSDVVQEVLDFFIQQVALLRDRGIQDIILDPGFGFGKTLEHNYRLLDQLDVFQTVLELPVLAGLSRKSMICKALRVSPEAALNGTTALHVIALQKGAKILRVHDVREAREVIELHEIQSEIRKT